MNGLKLTNLVIVLLTNGDNIRHIIVNESNTMEDVNVFPPKPIGIGAVLI
jgi:hypothetical protein